MNPIHKTNPDDLLDTFKGRGFGTIVLFTIIVHAVVILGSSVPFILRTVTGGNTKELSEKERIQAAVQEANAALRKIADEHGIQPQDLGSSFAGGMPKPAPAPPADAVKPTPPSDSAEAPADPDKPKSAIEQEIEKVEEGPEVPPVPEDDGVDLFR